MAEKKDVVIVGGGPNGLVAAGYLAKAGLKPVVLEKRGVVGGVAVTEEFAPGLQGLVGPPRGGADASVRSSATSASIATASRSSRRRSASSRRRRTGTRSSLYGDAARTAAEIGKVSAHDAKGYLAFHESLGRIGEAPRALR